MLPTTVEASFKILKKVLPNKTYLLECAVAEEIVKGVKFKVLGTLLDPDNNAKLATCDATLANIGAIPQARKERYGE